MLGGGKKGLKIFFSAFGVVLFFLFPGLGIAQRRC